MAKGWLTAKRLKMKKYREKSRGVMKSLSSERINVGKTPNKEIMSWYINSARGLGVSINDIYKYNSAPTSAERKAALDRAAEIRDARPEWRYFRLIDDRWLRAHMYYQDNPARCCVLELDPQTQRTRRSIVYRSRDVAYQRWLSRTIDWVEEADLYHPNIPETFSLTPPTD